MTKLAVAVALTLLAHNAAALTPGFYQVSMKGTDVDTAVKLTSRSAGFDGVIAYERDVVFFFLSFGNRSSRGALLQLPLRPTGANFWVSPWCKRFLTFQLLPTCMEHVNPAALNKILYELRYRRMHRSGTDLCLCQFTTRWVNQCRTIHSVRIQPAVREPAPAPSALSGPTRVVQLRSESSGARLGCVVATCRPRIADRCCNCEQLLTHSRRHCCDERRDRCDEHRDDRLRSATCPLKQLYHSGLLPSRWRDVV
jgi:hypothetical protein